MIHALYREDPAGQPMDDAKIAATVAEYRQHPEKLDIILIEKGGKATGYALLVYYWSNEYGGDILHIDELYVKEAHRGQGTGTAFFRYIEWPAGIAAMQIETTPSNRRAVDFYKRLGFAPSENTHWIKPV